MKRHVPWEVALIQTFFVVGFGYRGLHVAVFFIQVCIVDIKILRMMKT